MQETAPIACTLTDLDLRDRRFAWMKVGQYATEGGPIPGGLRFRFRPAVGVDDSLSTLIRLEAKCCAWMTFDLEPVGESLVVSITALGDDGERAVRESFSPLVELIQRR